MRAYRLTRRGNTVLPIIVDKPKPIPGAGARAR
jgi:hypothetical protein